MISANATSPAGPMAFARRFVGTQADLNRVDEDLAFDFHGDVEWESCDANRGARVEAAIPAEKVEQKIRAAVQDGREPVEPGCSIHHSEDPDPALDAVEIAQS